MDHPILRSRMLVLVAGVALALGVAFVLARASAADSPDSFSDSFVAGGYCAFPVRVEATGHGKLKELPGGDVLVVAKGHNFLFDPGVGIFLIVGRATFTVAGGPGVGGDITILETHGRVINVCESLA
jgi:hypothetical protein